MSQPRSFSDFEAVFPKEMYPTGDLIFDTVGPALFAVSTEELMNEYKSGDIEEGPEGES